jgi:hypothetical protein
MSKVLPFIFLVSVLSLFGISWIVVGVNPDNAPLYIFAVLIFLIFLATFGFLGLILYFLRTRFYKRYSAKWYFYTSFKMALFVAVFAGLISILAILRLITVFNIALLILAIILFALWSYLGKKGDEK